MRFPFAMVLIGVLIASLPTQSAGTRAATTQRCRVSKATSHPVLGRPSFNFGNAGIAVHLPAGATFIAVPDGRAGMAFIQKNGWIRTKVGWFTPHDTPRVTGRRTDRTGQRLRADVGARSYANGPFYPSLLYFPSLGCWQITATAGSAHLTATVNVRR